MLQSLRASLPFRRSNRRLRLNLRGEKRLLRRDFVFDCLLEALGKMEIGDGDLRYLNAERRKARVQVLLDLRMHLIAMFDKIARRKARRRLFYRFLNRG